MIRFDRFQVSLEDGFWLPTAIVRPSIRHQKKSFELSLVYEFPTSPAKYRDNFYNHPGQAPALLKQALLQKQGVWLAKVKAQDRELISQMWQRAVHAPWLERSGFFGPVSNSNFEYVRQNGLDASSSSHPPTVEVGSDSDEQVDASSSIDDDNSKILDGVPTMIDQARNTRYEVPAPGHESSDVILHGVPYSRQYTHIPTFDFSQNSRERPLGSSHEFARPDLNEVPNLSHEQAAHILDNAESLHGRQFYPFIADHSSRNFTVPNAHEFASHNAHDFASPSSSIAQVPEQGPSTAEHDFFNGQTGSTRIQPMPPKALYPWQQQPSQLLHQIQVPAEPTPPYLHSLRQKANVDLKRTLAPSHPESKRYH